MKITELPGVGAKRAHVLQSAGIFSVADLLECFPRDYDDRSKVKTVAELIPEAVNTLRGVVATSPESVRTKNFTLTKIKIRDHTGTLEIIWFNQPFLKKNFKKGEEYIFTGKVRENGALLQMLSPDYENTSQAELSGGRIVPIYTPPKGYSQKTFRKLVYSALESQNSKQLLGNSERLTRNVRGLNPFIENLPEKILAEFDLCTRGFAVKNIHFPESDEAFLAARRRLVFEELFSMQYALFNLKKSMKAQTGAVFSTDYAGFLAALPFSPTAAQGRVLAEIAADVAAGSRMSRLVQGDVGSGKTAVAFAAAYLAANSGFQTALMAPTDVLASQHFEACERLFAPLGIEAVLLTGSIPAKARREILAKIADGAAKIIIGTHALIQENVEYKNLGLCITDEQHRFGVNQRLALTKKGVSPHVLVMTATPIPRTLGLILYGDLDISIIDELPPGRVKIKTHRVNSSYRERIFTFIGKEINAGRQVYVICPSIAACGGAFPPEHEDTFGVLPKPDSVSRAELQSVTEYTQTLAAALPGAKIATLHGKMKDKQGVMDAFIAGEIEIIVATTVIEVGIHNPNASLIVIENAERFGLSQLHQLRGRVGRGTAESHCILVTDSANDQTRARMDAMTQTTDGFRLAQLDLEQRGAGDFFGARQHGLPEFKIANLYRDMDILKEVQKIPADYKGENTWQKTSET